MGGRVRCRECGTENQAGFGTCFSCGASLSAATAIRRGSVLAGRYEILSPLGRGGMGVVYKAHDRSLDEIVAVKLLREDLVATPDLTRRFLSEIKLARRVRHPNVCAIHEYGETDGTRYIAMEFIEGVNLRQVLEERGGPLPQTEAAEIGAQIARGLSAIHVVGIVHRDLKTPNIMRDVRGAVRLMDFGIAKSLDSETHATATGSVIGTPEYMSPEQARGEKVDVRSDIYSLGIVVFELLTGRVPFRAETPLGVLMKHVHEELPWREVSASVPVSQAARAILESALAKEPSDRFQSAAEMAAALEALAADAPTAHLKRATVSAPRRQRTATALQPMDVPNPTATQVPAAAPTWAESPPRTGSGIIPAARAHRKSAPWIAACAAGVAVAAAWAYVVTLPSDELPAGPVAEAAADPSALSAAANVARVAPPVTEPPAAPSPEIAPVMTMPARKATPAEIRKASATPAPAAEPSRKVRAAAVPERAPGPAAAADVPPVREPEVAAPAVVAEPTTAPPPIVAAAPIPAAAPEVARPAPAGRGLLMIQVKPEAEISIDGELIGRMGRYTQPLTAGLHAVVFSHPKYEPLSRKVYILPDERIKLVVDLKDEAVPRTK